MSSKLIRVDNELISVLEKLRTKIAKHGWDALNPGWQELTRVLARKIEAAKIV